MVEEKLLGGTVIGLDSNTDELYIRIFGNDGTYMWQPPLLEMQQKTRKWLQDCDFVFEEGNFVVIKVMDDPSLADPIKIIEVGRVSCDPVALKNFFEERLAAVANYEGQSEIGSETLPIRTNVHFTP